MVLYIKANNQVVSELLRKIIPPNSEMSNKLTTSNLTPWKESDDKTRQHIKGQRHYFANKGPSGQVYGFSSGHVWM